MNDVEKKKRFKRKKKLCGGVQYVYIHAKIICMYVAFNYTALTNKMFLFSFINL